MIKTLIFDLDGLLVDSEKNHYLAYNRALNEYNILLTERDFINHWTNNGLGIKEYLEKKSINISVKMIKDKKIFYIKI